MTYEGEISINYFQQLLYWWDLTSPDNVILTLIFLSHYLYCHEL